MPIRLEPAMLSVDAAKMHQVDTRNVENLFGMWTVFSKCAESIENGRRLENLSWRIWNRETLCCESQPQLTTTPAINISRSRPHSEQDPVCSVSVDSIALDAAGTVQDHHQARTAPVDIKSHLSRGTDFVQGRSRGKEKHITSLGLEKMVYSIKEKQELSPLSPTIASAVPAVLPSTDITPRPASPTLHEPLHSSESSSSTAPLSSPVSDHSATRTIESDTSVEALSSHSVVRGFSPSHVSSSYRSHTHLAPSPILPRGIPHVKTEESKLGGMFLLGASSGEDDSSLDESYPQRQSLFTAGLKRPLNPKKQTSFRDEVDLRTINQRPLADEEVFESDDEELAPESAIEDEDEDEEEDEDGSDWEDSVSDSGETLASDKNLFKRVDSRPNLVSRRSLLTTLMNQTDRAAAFAIQASKSTPALQRSRNVVRNGPSTGTSPDDQATLTTRGSKMTASKPIIMTTSNTHPPALSPRTTRRNMLATELTESLRKHLLWERQQKSTTANAVLRRRHTAFDVANLQEYPGQESGQSSNNGSRNNSWNYFDHGLGEYHQAGW
ncbi:hypothetical protein MMC07_002438 [Pseudocyphellaria aurata]|nr:hypothetical protein [Pseudocyphellaria aurata]